MSIVILQGATREYRLEFGVNARCRVEEATGQPFTRVFRELAGRTRPRLSTVRAFLSALLVDPEQPDEATIDPILKDIGGVPRVRKIAQGAWRAHRQNLKEQKG